MTESAGITGTTKTVFVVADPVYQLRTPQAQNRIWGARGSDVVTVPAHVRAGLLGVFIESLRANESAAGAVISIPHKQAVAEFCDDLGAAARAVGAVNAIRRSRDGHLIGETFDGDGFVAGLRAQGIEPAGRRVRLLGAGGAASAIGVALARAGVASIRLENRTAHKAEALAERIRVGTGLTDVSAKAGEGDDDLFVNATSQGMRPDDEVAFRFERMAPNAVAAEVIVSDRPTPFLAAASGVGLRVHEGRHMLDGQMKLIADFLLEA